MHIEILVEDSSTAELLKILVPKLIGPHGDPHTWNLHPYKGSGRLPQDLHKYGDPAKRVLLDQLPRLLRGLGAATSGVDLIMVVVDADGRDCKGFLSELKGVATACKAESKTMFRLAIEETEAWYLGDKDALRAAYPRAKPKVLRDYEQDGVCGTWEVLANAVVDGGLEAVRRRGGPLPGDLKHEWAQRIGPLMALDSNNSPSFHKFCEGLRNFVAAAD
jgi:hypothetical protein